MSFARVSSFSPLSSPPAPSFDDAFANVLNTQNSLTYDAAFEEEFLAAPLVSEQSSTIGSLEGSDLEDLPIDPSLLALVDLEGNQATSAEPLPSFAPLLPVSNGPGFGLGIRSEYVSLEAVIAFNDSMQGLEASSSSRGMMHEPMFGPGRHTALVGDIPAKMAVPATDMGEVLADSGNSKKDQVAPSTRKETPEVMNQLARNKTRNMTRTLAQKAVENAARSRVAAEMRVAETEVSKAEEENTEKNVSILTLSCFEGSKISGGEMSFNNGKELSEIHDLEIDLLALKREAWTSQFPKDETNSEPDEPIFHAPENPYMAMTEGDATIRSATQTIAGLSSWEGPVAFAANQPKADPRRTKLEINTERAMESSFEDHGLRLDRSQDFPRLGTPLSFVKLEEDNGHALHREAQQDVVERRREQRARGNRYWARGANRGTNASSTPASSGQVTPPHKSKPGLSPMVLKFLELEDDDWMVQFVKEIRKGRPVQNYGVEWQEWEEVMFPQANTVKPPRKPRLSTQLKEAQQQQEQQKQQEKPKKTRAAKAPKAPWGNSRKRRGGSQLGASGRSKRTRLSEDSSEKEDHEMTDEGSQGLLQAPTPIDPALMMVEMDFSSPPAAKSSPQGRKSRGQNKGGRGSRGGRRGRGRGRGRGATTAAAF
ncbi:hypothetical protein CFO_g93 [Ceratocystis platani]|uniref:Uncharacterized protein n=1 Tax=Ceratocystis fimbriata f. sp. platani TaxID=88771 RepID=A0A0F8B963_CERFI|nr:hypothetical protein CFO_g93 [Ceratocystis platani]